MSAAPPATLGVVGAGTMGAGICQLGCAAGMRVLLHDPVPAALKQGAGRARHGLDRWVAKGRVRRERLGALETVDELSGLAPCELVIEAAPERPDLKSELFAALSEVCAGDAVLATNTSSIPVTELAGAAARPENVVGMHFFNPPPLMELLEVIRADQTGDRAVEIARAAGEAMGKTVILASDGPGFLVNRCGRPFGAEALRLLQERVAGHEEIDRIVRLGGGFRMGPFELMDLVGRRRGLRGGEVVHRAVVRRAALEAQPDPGADGGRRAPGPEIRARVLRLSRGSEAPAGRPGGARAGRRWRPPAEDHRRRRSRTRAARPGTGREVRPLRGRHPVRGGGRAGAGGRATRRGWRRL